MEAVMARHTGGSATAQRYVGRQWRLFNATLPVGMLRFWKFKVKPTPKFSWAGDDGVFGIVSLKMLTLGLPFFLPHLPYDLSMM
jgi:hypothetical protein